MARRLIASVLGIVILCLPLAFERCRTACAGATRPQQAAASVHSCHEVSDQSDAPTLASSARACGHNDEADVAQSIIVAVKKFRSGTTVLVVSTAAPAGERAALAFAVFADHPLPRRLQPAGSLPLRI